MSTFNQYQYQDLLNREHDLYSRAKYRIILDWLANRGSLNILNTGCGSGELSFALVKTGHKVTGFDPDPEYIALANKNKTKLGIKEDCSFLLNSIEDYASQNLYDCVIATDVLEHIKDDKAAVLKLARLLGPGGLLIIAVPALPFLFGYHDKALGHWRRYTKSSLTKLIETTGLAIKKNRYFGFTLIPISILYSRVLRKPYPIATSGKGVGHSIRQTILKQMLSFDRAIPMPLGTSLICVAVKQ